MNAVESLRSHTARLLGIFICLHFPLIALIDWLRHGAPGIVTGIGAVIALSTGAMTFAMKGPAVRYFQSAAMMLTVATLVADVAAHLLEQPPRGGEVPPDRPDVGLDGADRDAHGEAPAARSASAGATAVPGWTPPPAPLRCERDALPQRRRLAGPLRVTRPTQAQCRAGKASRIRFTASWISGSGWYPNFRQPQLFRRGAMRYTLEPVHEGYENLSGKPLGVLNNAVWQFPFRNLEELIDKMNRYSSLGVPKLAGKRVSMASALGHGLWSFVKHYVFKRGFLDGWAGFVIALGNFEGTFYRYAKRYEETQDWQPPASKAIRRERSSP